jgi:hypothetical protein
VEEGLLTSMIAESKSAVSWTAASKEGLAGKDRLGEVHWEQRGVQERGSCKE